MLSVSVNPVINVYACVLAKVGTHTACLPVGASGKQGAGSGHAGSRSYCISPFPEESPGLLAVLGFLPPLSLSRPSGSSASSPQTAEVGLRALQVQTRSQEELSCPLRAEPPGEAVGAAGAGIPFRVPSHGGTW